jgi:hypothetical protein
MFLSSPIIGQSRVSAIYDVSASARHLGPESSDDPTYRKCIVLYVQETDMIFPRLLAARIAGALRSLVAGIAPRDLDGADGGDRRRLWSTFDHSVDRHARRVLKQSLRFKRSKSAYWGDGFIATAGN